MFIRLFTSLLLIAITIGAAEANEESQDVSDPQSSWSWLDKDGNPVPDTSWKKHSGRLGAMLFFTADPEGLYKRWDEPTPGVYLFETDTVARGDSVLVTVVFSGCQPDNDGMCQLVVRYRITDTDGRELGPSEPTDLWLNKPAPRKGAQQLAAHGVMYGPEEVDKGPLEVKAYIMDRVNNNRLLLSRELKIK